MFIQKLRKNINDDNYSPFGGSPRHKKRFTYEQALDMKAMRSKGFTYQAIGDKYKCARAFVRQTLKLNGLLELNKEEVPSSYFTVTQYAKSTGEKTRNIYYHMQQGNLDYVKFNKTIYIKDTNTIRRRVLNDDKVEKILTLQGIKTEREIAKIVGCSNATVHRYHKLLGK